MAVGGRVSRVIGLSNWGSLKGSFKGAGIYRGCYKVARRFRVSGCLKDHGMS